MADIDDLINLDENERSVMENVTRSKEFDNEDCDNEFDNEGSDSVNHRDLVTQWLRPWRMYTARCAQRSSLRHPGNGSGGGREGGRGGIVGSERHPGGLVGLDRGGESESASGHCLLTVNLFWIFWRGGEGTPLPTYVGPLSGLFLSRNHGYFGGEGRGVGLPESPPSGPPHILSSPHTARNLSPLSLWAAGGECVPRVPAWLPVSGGAGAV